MFEVEQKFHIEDSGRLLQQLSKLGVTLEPAVVQVDQYYNHPSRDFGTTDEAFRLRSVGDSNWITYKGPKLDKETKTRREIELPLINGTGVKQSFDELLRALGFRPVLIVAKRRRTGHLLWKGMQVEVAHDDVEQVGTYLELEIVASAAQADDARAAIASLAVELGLSTSERRSYLELLIAGLQR